MMNISIKIYAPEGMSCVNVFHALWKEAAPDCYRYGYHPALQADYEKMVDTSEKIADLLKHQTYFDRVGGRTLCVDFSQFPEIDVTKYNQLHGDSMATIALRIYGTISPKKRFDPHDSCYFETKKDVPMVYSISSKNKSSPTKKSFSRPFARLTLRKKFH